ncbi:MAG: MoaD/ThiS family protein [Kiritimatiellia bacterium]|jgi:molybdopterin converting factor small subunit|nr:MoaD/ThiS family protein [Kiritimatiellia bacterium]
MNITVEYTAQLKARTGCSDETFEVDSSCDLPALFSAIAGRHGDPVREIVLDAQDTPVQVLCFVNDKQVDWGAPPQLAEGAKITIMSPISGG